jgi:EmrB/QacA subfamily drug resistance transporter
MREPTSAALAHERWILVITIGASSVAFIDMTIVNLALPVIQREMLADFMAMQWVVEAYMLLMTSAILAGGALADSIGAKRTLGAGALLFTAASVAAGLAISAEMLIGARALQGLGGALLAPASLAIVTTSVSPDRRGRALGLWAAFSAVSTALAAPLGGVLLEWWSWRSIFFINVPILLAVLMLSRRHLAPDSQSASLREVDFFGASLAVLGLGALTFGLLRAGTTGFADSIVGLALLTSAIAMTLFVRVQQRAAHPMLPLELFDSSAFTRLNLMTLVLFMAVAAVMFFLPMMLVQAYHYSPVQAGAAMMPSMFMMFMLAPLSGRLTDRFGAQALLTIGPLVSASAYLLFALREDPTYWSGVLVPTMVMGAGFGLWVTPLTSAVMAAAGDHRSGIASGINNAVARLAQLLAIACMGLLAHAVFNVRLDEILATTTLSQTWLVALENGREYLGGMRPPGGMGESDQKLVSDAVATAFRSAFGAVAAASAALAVLASLIGLRALPKPNAEP